MEHHVLDFEELFEEYSVGVLHSCLLGDIEHTVCTERRRPKGGTYMGMRGTQLLHALTERIELPNGSSECTQKIVDLAQGWSDAVGTESPHADFFLHVI